MKKLLPVVAPHHDMVERPVGVQAWAVRHGQDRIMRLYREATLSLITDQVSYALLGAEG